MPQRRGAGAVAAAAAVLVLAVVGSALAPPWRLLPRSWLRSPDSPPVLPSVLPAPSGRPSPQPIGGRAYHVDLSWLAPLGILVGVIGLAAVLWWLWRRYQQSAVHRGETRDTGGVVVLPSTPEVPVLRQGVAAAQRHLDEIADPNNAIVAAWLALEAAASSSGVTRRPAETPTEFTVDILRVTAADPRATRDLLALYHRARFSAAGVTRADVASASRCLADLARSWDAMSADAITAAVTRGSGSSAPERPTPGRSTQERPIPERPPPGEPEW